MDYNTKKKTKIILGIFISTLFLPILISNSKITPATEIHAAQAGEQVADFYVAKTPTDEFHLIYREKIAEFDQICYLESNNEYIWNHTKTILVKENSTHRLYSRPSITTKNDEIYSVYGFTNLDQWGINMLYRATDTFHWTEEVIINDIEGHLNDPIIAYDTNQSNFWVSWEDDHEGNYSQYVMIGNSTTMTWSAPIKLSTNDLFDSKEGSFVIDKNGHGHFVWREGAENYEQVLYRKVWFNGTLSDIEEVTDGTHRSLKPSIIIDGSDKLNVFWNNHSVINPTFRGTKFVSSSIKENGNWITPFEVGPYIPPERPASGESDAFTAAACLDQRTNDVWLAYEIAEDYAYHTGIDIRNRDGNSWEPSSQLTLINNLAKDPQLISTTDGDIVCFWIDGRSVTNQVYFRIRFASEAWSEEIVLTAFSYSDISIIWKYVLIALGGALVLAIPSLIMRAIHKKRQEKYVKEKMREMN